MHATGYAGGEAHRTRCDREGREEMAGQVATMHGEPQSNEVLEARMDRLEREHSRDRDEMMAKITSGFAEVKTDIGNLRFVHPEVFTAWQTATEARFERIANEVVWNRRLLIGSVGGAIVTALAAGALGVGPVG